MRILGVLCVATAVSVHESKVLQERLLEEQLLAKSPKPLVIAEMLIALAGTDAGSVNKETLGSEALARKAQSAMQAIRKRVDSERHMMWKSLEDAYHAVENCIMEKERAASLLADVEVEASQTEVDKMADLDKMASDHRSCRMEEDSARAALTGCQTVASRGAICDPLQEAHQAQKKICNDAQILLEEKACRLASKSTICDERVKCHEEQTKAYLAAKEKAELHERQLRKEEHALVQIECILSAGPGSYADCKDLLQTPRSATVTASGKVIQDPVSLIEFPKPPSAKACLGSDEAKNLLTSFFFGLPQGAPAQACKCCADNAILMDISTAQDEKDFHWKLPSGVLSGVPIYSRAPRMDVALNEEVGNEEVDNAVQTVKFLFNISNLDYSKLMGNHSVLANFRTAMKDGIVSALPLGHTEEDIKLVLQPHEQGVSVQASIMPQNKAATASVKQAMKEAADVVALTNRIKAIAGIKSASTGDIKMQVSHAPAKHFQLVTPCAKPAEAPPAPAQLPTPCAKPAQAPPPPPTPCAPRLLREEITTPAPCAAKKSAPEEVAAPPKPVTIISPDRPCPNMRGRYEWIIMFPPGTKNSVLQQMADEFPSKDQYKGHPNEKGLPVIVTWATQDELAVALHKVPGATYVEQVADLDGSPEKNEQADGDSPLPWGLDRIDSEGEPDGHYLAAGPDGGRGIHVYILDSGIRTTHGQMGGRAIPTLEALNAKPRACSSTDIDCAADKNGHGTHAAATIGGSTVGVAQGAWMHAVKILNDQGKGNTANFIIAMDWLLVNAERPAVIYASLRGAGTVQESRAVKDAIDAAVDAGMTVVVGAGDDNKDSCLESPAYVPSAITVGATKDDDEMDIGSNYGNCVDIFAPGWKVKTADSSSDNSYALVSGTSMAAAHVAGAAALVLGVWSNDTTKEVHDELTNNAFDGILDSIKSGSPNKLLSVSFVLNVFPIVIGPSQFGTSHELEQTGATKFRKKCVTVSKEVVCPINSGDFGQRLGFDEFRGSFNITVEGNSVCATRVDNIVDDFLPNDKFSNSKNDGGGWTLNLVVLCNLKDSIPPTDKWVFEKYGEKEKPQGTMCAGNSPADRQSLYYASFADVKSGDGAEVCESLCKSRYGCKGYSYEPQRICEVWLHPINSFSHAPTDYKVNDGMKCMRYLGRGTSGSGSIRAAAVPKSCLAVSENNALIVTSCDKSSTSQQLAWAGVGAIAVPSNNCFSVSPTQVEGADVRLSPCTPGADSQQFAFEGSGVIRFAGGPSKEQEWCLNMDLEKNNTQVKVQKCDLANPNMQFFF